MRIFHYDRETGELIAEGAAVADPLDGDNWLIPAHATTSEPPAGVAGKRRVFDGQAWALLDLPPSPPPPPSPSAAETRRREILAALVVLDAKSIRPLREGDAARVAALEAEAATLRVELAALAV